MAESETMTAVFLEEPGRFATREVPAPEPGPHEVVVGVKACGVCGSDIHFYENGRIGDFVVREPLVLGHEAAGRVLRVGEEVDPARVGQRVAMEPGIPCRRCDYCLDGRYNLCRDVVFLSAPPHDGFFREQVALPEDFAHPLPDGVSYEAGATVEPLAVGLQAIALVGLKPADRVVVLGAGPIGLMATASCRALGADAITVVDLLPSRLEAAEDIGADAVVNAEEADPAEELADCADVVLDCVAVEETLWGAFDIVRPGGRVAWVGMAAETARLPFQQFQVKEVLLTGVFRYANRFPAAISLLATGQVDTAPLVTHRFEFPRVAQAVTFAAENRRQALKTMVEFT